MINLLTIIILLFVYFFVNLFFFNFLKSYKAFFVFISFYLVCCQILLDHLNFNFIYLYLILLFLCIISFKFFSYLFFENSPTLFLCEIVKNNKNYDDIKNIFLLNVFIKKYVDNLVKSNLINSKHEIFYLNKKGKYFFLFFKKFFYFIF